jgi:hypothetical protein
VFNEGFEKISISKDFVDRAHEGFINKKFKDAYNSASQEKKDQLDDLMGSLHRRIQKRLDKSEQYAGMRRHYPGFKNMEREQLKAAVKDIRTMYSPLFPSKKVNRPKLNPSTTVSKNIETAPMGAKTKSLIGLSAIAALGGGAYLFHKNKKEKNDFNKKVEKEFRKTSPNINMNSNKSAENNQSTYLDPAYSLMV